MKILNLDNDNPNPKAILANAIDEFNENEWEQVVVLCMRGDADSISYNRMSMAELCYAAAILNKLIQEKL